MPQRRAQRREDLPVRAGLFVRLQRGTDPVHLSFQVGEGAVLLGEGSRREHHVREAPGFGQEGILTDQQLDLLQRFPDAGRGRQGRERVLSHQIQRLDAPLAAALQNLHQRRARIGRRQRAAPRGRELGTGATLMEILKRCREGRIKALYLVGENPLATLPASTGVREALEKVELLVCQDPFLTETGRLAHVVLPATTFAEKDGTFTNLEGKVNRVRPALEPYEEARPDWEIFAALGTALGYPMEYEAAQDVQREIMKFLPGYYNLGEPRPVTARPEGYLRDGYVREVAARYAAGAEADQAGRPFALTIGQVLYHSGKLSARASGLLQLYPSKGCLQRNPADLSPLQLCLQDVRQMSSTRGSVELRTEPNHDLARGTCFFPEHFNEPPVKDLAECVVDPTTGVPAFKFTHVAIEKL